MQVLVIFLSFVTLANLTCGIAVSETKAKVEKTKQLVSGTKLKSCNTYSNTNFIWKSQKRDKASRSLEGDKDLEAAEEKTLSSIQTDLCLAYEKEDDPSKRGECFMNSACLVNNYEFNFTYPLGVDKDFDCCYIRTSFANLHNGISNNGSFTCDCSDQRQNYWLQKQCKALCDFAVPSFVQNTWYPNLCQNPFNPNIFDQCVCQIAELG